HCRSSHHPHKCLFLRWLPPGIVPSHQGVRCVALERGQVALTGTATETGSLPAQRLSDWGHYRRDLWVDEDCKVHLHPCRSWPHRYSRLLCGVGDPHLQAHERLVDRICADCNLPLSSRFEV